MFIYILDEVQAENLALQVKTARQNIPFGNSRVGGLGNFKWPNSGG